MGHLAVQLSRVGFASVHDDVSEIGHLVQLARVGFALGMDIFAVSQFCPCCSSRARGVCLNLGISEVASASSVQLAA